MKNMKIEDVMVREAEIVDELNRLTNSINSAKDTEKYRNEIDSCNREITRLEGEREKLHEEITGTYNLKNFKPVTEADKIKEILPLYIFDMRTRKSVESEITTLDERDVDDIVYDQRLHQGLRPNVLMDEDNDIVAIVYPRSTCTLVSMRRLVLSDET